MPDDGFPANIGPHPMLSGSGEFAYDPSTSLLMIERSDAGSFGSQTVTPHVGPFHELLHWLQHVGTSVGVFTIIGRSVRRSAVGQILNSYSQEKLEEYGYSSGATRRALIAGAPLGEILDPPPAGTPVATDLRTIWYHLLLGERYFSYSRLLPANLKRPLLLGMQAIGYAALFTGEHLPSTDNGRRLGPLARLHESDPDAGHDLDAILIMEAMASVVELALLLHDLPRFHIRLRQVRESGYLVPVEVFFRDSPWALSDAALMRLLPEFLVICDIALNPPLPPFLSTIVLESIQDLLPSYRFRRLCQVWFKTKQPIITPDSHLSLVSDVRQRKQELCYAARIPVANPWTFKPRQQRMEEIGRWLSDTSYQTEFISANDWTLYLRARISEFVVSHGAPDISAMFLELVRRGSRLLDDVMVPPIVVLKSDMSLRGNAHILTSPRFIEKKGYNVVLLAHVIQSAADNIMCRNGSITLPFGIGEAIYAQEWKVAREHVILEMLPEMVSNPELMVP